MARPSPSLWTFAAIACSVVALIQSHLSFELADDLADQVKQLESYVAVLEKSFYQARARLEHTEAELRGAKLRAVKPGAESNAPAIVRPPPAGASVRRPRASPK